MQENYNQNGYNGDYSLNYDYSQTAAPITQNYEQYQQSNQYYGNYDYSYANTGQACMSVPNEQQPPTVPTQPIFTHQNMEMQPQTVHQDPPVVEAVPVKPEKPLNMQQQQLKRSVLPAHVFKKKNKPRADNSDRPPSRTSINSEIDQYAQWYQMLTQYYKQYYPHIKLPEFRPSPGSSSATQSLEYANFCYQFYMEAQNQWANVFMTGAAPVQSDDGRRTPHLFHTPHMRASISVPGLLLQILPSRPMDNEAARIEMLDLNQIANEAIAEAAVRTMHSRSLLNSSYNPVGDQSALSLAEESQSMAAMSDDLNSSKVAFSDSEDDEVTRVCADITGAWDRLDNVFFPGPLSVGNTLKADILVYLKEKMTEIQDRLPFDWESASLLLNMLEQLVKNNGVLQSADLVSVILDGHDLKTSDLRDRLLSRNNEIVPDQQQHHQPRAFNSSFDNNHQSELHTPSHLMSGRNSPSRSRSIASSVSEMNGMHNLILKAAQATSMMVSAKGDRDLEDRALDRFRQLLMHGLTQKAIEHACRTQLWGHAFALAQRLNHTQLMNKVMDRFMKSALHPQDPVMSMYQILGMEMPQIVNSVAYASGVDTGEWRPHLAILLSLKDDRPELVYRSLERMGDSLLARHLVFAAHVCYLLLDQVQEHHSKLPGKIWLLGHCPESETGVAKPFYRDPNDSDIYLDEEALDDRVSVPTEVIQLTEIYEYTRALRNQSFVLIDLLPYKLAYVLRLIDSGLCETAFKYLECIGRALSLHFQHKGLEQIIHKRDFGRMLEITLSLAVQLQYHPDVIGQLTPPDPRNYPILAQNQELLAFCACDWIATLTEIQDAIHRQ
ncbi:Protein transport protein Sec16A, partial [Cichlidogyrus casuarinus]